MRRVAGRRPGTSARGEYIGGRAEQEVLERIDGRVMSAFVRARKPSAKVRPAFGCASGCCT